MLAVTIDATKTKCRRCSHPIVWTFTAANTRRMPVDLRPVRNGNLLLSVDRSGDIISTVVEPHPDKLRHVAHFVTCPYANRYRKKKGGKK